MKWLALVGLGGVALWVLWPRSASATVPPTTKPPVPVKPSTPKPTTPPVQAQDVSTSLTSDEQLELDNGSRDLLYASGMVTPHKVYATAVANKLAEAGDTRSADVNQRVAMWSPAIAGAGLTADEEAIVSNPIGFTLDGIVSEASQSDHPGFVRWAAEFLRHNGRAEQADALLMQLSTGR